MTDTTDTTTVLEKMLRAGIAEDRARAHLEAGRVRVDGETVTDPEAPGGVRVLVVGQ